MGFDKKMLAHLQELARIELTPEEEDRLTEQLASIVRYCEQLQEVNTENIAPTSAVVHEADRKLRPDIPEKGLDRDIVLAQAPDAVDGFFRVPKIVER